MFKELKLCLKLAKYGYRAKTNRNLLILFLIIGTLFEVLSKGTSVIGGMYIMLIGTFLHQMILAVTLSELVQSSGMKKDMQGKFPCMISMLAYLVIYTLLLVERGIFIRLNPAKEEEVIFSLFLVIITMVAVFVLSGVYCKYYAAGFLLFMVLFMGGFYGFIMLWESGGLHFSGRFGMVAVLGYAVIFAGSAVVYLLETLLYRKPLSEFAFRGMFRDAK